MPILFAGSALSDFDVNTGIFASITDTNRLAPFILEGMQMRPSDSVRGRFRQEASSYWVSYYGFYQSANTVTNHQVILGKTTVRHLMTSNIAIYVRGGSNSTAAIQLYVDGNLVGTGPAIASSVLYRVDARIRIGEENGLVEVYQDGLLIISYSGDTSSVGPTHDMLMVTGGANVAGIGTQIVSGFMVSTADSRLRILKSMALTGNGALNDFTGDYTDIDETGIDDTDFIYSANVGDQSTFIFDKPEIPADYTIDAIVINGRVSKYGDMFEGVTAIQYDGVDVTSVFNYATPDVIYEGRQAIVDVNPVTGVRYTPEEYAAMEFGFRVD